MLRGGKWCRFWAISTGKGGKVLLQRHLWCPTTSEVKGLRRDRLIDR